MTQLVIWLDDERDPTEPIWRKYIYDRTDVKDSIVLHCKSYQSFLDCIQDVLVSSIQIKAIFFDHDLGERYSGYDAINFVEPLFLSDKLNETQLFCQSMNPSGKFKINQTIANIQRYWYERTK